jgi:hypothetical protein
LHTTKRVSEHLHQMGIGDVLRVDQMMRNEKLEDEEAVGED